MAITDQPFVVLVTDLIGDPGARRTVVVEGPLDVELPAAATTDAPATVTADLLGTVDGLVASGTVSAEVAFTCNRCLTDWTAPHEATFWQVYGVIDPDVVEDDELDASAVEPLPDDGAIDVGAVARDEFSVSLPLVPVCREDCKGLCPACGTDLNREPCSGHPDDSDSPFAALEGLFGSDTGSDGGE